MNNENTNKYIEMPSRGRPRKKDLMSNYIFQNDSYQLPSEYCSPNMERENKMVRKMRPYNINEEQMNSEKFKLIGDMFSNRDNINVFNDKQRQFREIDRIIENEGFGGENDKTTIDKNEFNKIAENNIMYPKGIFGKTDRSEQLTNETYPTSGKKFNFSAMKSISGLNLNVEEPSLNTSRIDSGYKGLSSKPMQEEIPQGGFAQKSILNMNHNPNFMSNNGFKVPKESLFSASEDEKRNNEHGLNISNEKRSEEYNSVNDQRSPRMNKNYPDTNYMREGTNDMNHTGSNYMCTNNIHTPNTNIYTPNSNMYFPHTNMHKRNTEDKFNIFGYNKYISSNQQNPSYEYLDLEINDNYMGQKINLGVPGQYNRGNDFHMRPSNRFPYQKEISQNLNSNSLYHSYPRQDMNDQLSFFNNNPPYQKPNSFYDPLGIYKSMMQSDIRSDPFDNQWFYKKKRKVNPVLWNYVKNIDDNFQSQIHPSKYSSFNYIQGIDPIKSRQVYTEREYNNSVLPIYLNSNKELNDEYRQITNNFRRRVNEIDFTNVTVHQLKNFMKEFGLGHTGKKNELIDRAKATLIKIDQMSLIKKKYNEPDRKSELKETDDFESCFF